MIFSPKQNSSSLPVSAHWYDVYIAAILIVGTGGQTTSSAIAALLFYLARYPDCYRRLTDEIRSNFTRNDQIEHTKLSTCIYLRACIDEALRLSPPAAGTLWREVPENSGERVVVDGHIIPKGTSVGVNVYAIHHNEEYFPNPSTFRPERWIPKDTPEMGEKMRKSQQNAFMPFSIGSRGCIGKALACMEISLVVAKTLWYFDFEEHTDYRPKEQKELPTTTEEYLIRDQLIATHDGPYLVFKTTGNP
jgi:cytochrome P450